MVGRSGIFEGEDPFAIARRWLDEARTQEPNDPDAAALATIDADGLPNVRVVLMRGFDTNGFLVFTNYDSAKGDWTEVADLPMRYAGNQLEVSVPRELLGLGGDRFVFDFKWSDNPADLNDPISLCLNGDTAPNRRFNYRCIWSR